MLDEYGNIKRNKIVDFLIRKKIAKDEKQASLYTSIVLTVITIASLYIVYNSFAEEEIDERSYSELSPAEKAQLPAEYRLDNENNN